ncbi:hypothetical protein [Salmonella enterica]|uniref:hypothetical protein n=1 Tax=Salmonella enterica TaxID=28901 RepID=UPI0038577AD2
MTRTAASRSGSDARQSTAESADQQTTPFAVTGICFASCLAMLLGNDINCKSLAGLQYKYHKPTVETTFKKSERITNQRTISEQINHTGQISARRIAQLILC